MTCLKTMGQWLPNLYLQSRGSIISISKGLTHICQLQQLEINISSTIHYSIPHLLLLVHITTISTYIIDQLPNLPSGFQILLPSNLSSKKPPGDLSKICLTHQLRINFGFLHASRAFFLFFVKGKRKNARWKEKNISEKRFLNLILVEMSSRNQKYGSPLVLREGCGLLTQELSIADTKSHIHDNAIKIGSIIPRILITCFI